MELSSQAWKITAADESRTWLWQPCWCYFETCFTLAAFVSPCCFTRQATEVQRPFPGEDGHNEMVPATEMGVYVPNSL